MDRWLERLGIWLGFVAGGAGLVYVAATAATGTPSVIQGALLVVGIALLAVGILGFAVEIVGFVSRMLPDRLPAPYIPPQTSQPGPHAATGAKQAESAAPPAVVAKVPAVVAKPSLPKVAQREFVAASVVPGQFLHPDGRDIGKWMPIRGPVKSTQIFEKSAVVHLSAEEKPLSTDIALWFPQSSVKRVGALKPDEAISAIGRITSIAAVAIVLQDCEFVGSGTSAE